MTKKDPSAKTQKSYPELIGYKPGWENTITGFFYRSVTTPRPKTGNASEWQMTSYGIKFIFGALYFRMGGKWHDLVSYITRYYPFSLLWRDRLYHAQNLPVRNLMNAMQKVAEKTQIPIVLIGGHSWSEYGEIEGKFLQDVKDTEIARKKLEEAFQAKFGLVYVRVDGENLKVIVPNSLLAESL